MPLPLDTWRVLRGPPLRPHARGPGRALSVGQVRRPLRAPARPQFGAAGLIGADDRADSVPPSAEGEFKPDAPYQAFLDTAIEDLLKEKEQVSYATATKAAGTATESAYVYQGVCPARSSASRPGHCGRAAARLLFSRRPRPVSLSRGTDAVQPDTWL